LIWWNKGGQPPRLKKWLMLEIQKENVIKAIGEGSNFPSELLSYLSIALGVSYSWYRYADWTLLVRAFYLCLSKSPQVKLPITSPSDEKKSKEDAWEYDGRTWHLYCHLLAKNYGWTIEYISQLQVEEALSKIQEIVVDEQLDKEFYYGLSEVAYAYDKSTKKSKFVPLPRPAWMRPQVRPDTIKKVMIPASMLPVGNVIMDGVLPPEMLPKEIIH
jgi:hypothetical protein